MINPLGEVLRLIRLVNDLSIKKLSEKTGISSSYICDMEKGNKPPTLRAIDKYSVGLGIDKPTIFVLEKEIDVNNFQKSLRIVLDKMEENIS